MSVRTATSADGLHWAAGPELPIRDGLEPSALYKYNDLFLSTPNLLPSTRVREGTGVVGRGSFGILPILTTGWPNPDSRFSFPNGRTKGFAG